MHFLNEEFHFFLLFYFNSYVRRKPVNLSAGVRTGLADPRSRVTGAARTALPHPNLSGEARTGHHQVKSWSMVVVKWKWTVKTMWTVWSGRLKTQWPQATWAVAPPAAAGQKARRISTLVNLLQLGNQTSTKQPVNPGKEQVFLSFLQAQVYILSLRTISPKTLYLIFCPNFNAQQNNGFLPNFFSLLALNLIM